MDCRRRFQLRYLLELAWPAIQAEPAEEQEIHARQGELFHRLAQQHQLGIASERLSSIAEAAGAQGGGNRLALWWDNYLQAGPADLPRQRLPEITLSAAVAGHRLVAKYDLIAHEPGSRIVIVDWKTSRARPSRVWLSARLQTRVYRYVLVEAATALNGNRSWRPDEVEMVYWFANHPARPERLRYSAKEYEADREYLSALISEIAHAPEDDFFLTEEVQRCRLCTYRSLCDRGIEAGLAGTVTQAPEEAGDVDEATPTWESDFDFEQVAEIAY